MPSRKQVTAVRPYQFEDDIRVRVFAHIENAGLELAERHIIAPGTPDAEALAIVASRRDHVFLVPFHAHRDPEGNRLTGLGFLKLLDRDAPELSGCPVLMPVTTSAELVVDAYISAGADTTKRVLVLPETRLAEPELTQEIQRHVESWPLAY